MSGEASQLTSNGCLLWSVGAVEGAEPFSVLLGGHGASQQWGDPLEKRQDPRLTPMGLRVTLHPQQPLPSSQVRRVKTILISGCPGTSGHCSKPTPCPPSPSQALSTKTALNQHWVQHPHVPLAQLCPLTPEAWILPACTWARDLCDQGAALPGFFRKLLDETRLTSWADVILWEERAGECNLRILRSHVICLCGLTGHSCPGQDTPWALVSGPSKQKRIGVRPRMGVISRNPSVKLLQSRVRPSRDPGGGYGQLRAHINQSYNLCILTCSSAGDLPTHPHPSHRVSVCPLSILADEGSDKACSNHGPANAGPVKLFKRMFE